MIYYVDSSFTAQGDGSSPENPLRSHDAIQPKPGDSVLFRRGTSYRSGIYPPDGGPGAPISFGAYGEGDEPRFYGSVNASNPRDWVAEGACVWRYAGTLASEACNIVFDYGESFGVMAWTRDGLDSTGKWFFSAPFSTDHTPADAALLLYSESNPAECHRDIEICVFGKRRMATGGRHLRFSDLHFLCSGVHGFAGTDVEAVRIERCKFSFIGGCPWSVEGHIRFGNGVEFWDGARNCVVTGCEFREIYDSCATTQGPGENCRQFEEIHIDGNRCENYGMAAFELRDRIGRDVTFNGNSCEGAGAGFSMQDETPPRALEIYPEPMGHHIFAWRIEHAWPDGRIEILRNTFAGVPTGTVFYRRISDAALSQIKTDIEDYKMDETTISRADRAAELFKSGLNCAQAVFCAFADEFGMDDATAQKVSCGLGGGVGRMREVCGTVTGASLVLGMRFGPDKAAVYPSVQDLCAKFKDETGSIVCRELLAGTGATQGGSPEARTPAYYKKRPCVELVRLAAALLEADALK